MNGNQCPQCGTPFIPGTAFCDNCGMALAHTPVPAGQASPPTPAGGGNRCPQCGAAIMPGMAFCDNCGTALETGAMQKLTVTEEPATQPGITAGGTSSTSPTVAAGERCPSCDTPLPEDAAFCDNCGRPLQQSQAPAPEAGQQQQWPQELPATEQLADAQPQIPAHPPQQWPPAPAAPRLVIQKSNASIDLPSKPEVVIGREDQVSNHFPEIDLTPHGGEEGGVSRKHARVTAQGSQYYIEDLNSVNYTYVNRQRLEPGQRQALNEGDELRFGRVIAIFHSR